MRGGLFNGAGAVGHLLRRAFALDGRSLACFRIAVGVILVADAALRTRDFSLMFAPDGMFPLDLLRRFYDHDPSAWSLAFAVDASWWGAAVLALEGLAGVWLACGWATTWATVVAWVAVVSVVRRTMPATNAGDVWLCCLLFWSMFLPLGGTWSVDARRRRSPAAGPEAAATAVFSLASIGLVLQIMAVYLHAGMAKCNDSWLSGDAMGRALSVHDHGTPLGMWLAESGWLLRPLTWAVLALELILPIAWIGCASAPIRVAIVAAFVLFHLLIWATMSVGLFAAIGIAAWLALIPAAAWPSRGPVAPAVGPAPNRVATILCGAAILLAIVSFVHGTTPWRSQPLPRPIRAAINVACLEQEWGMFGFVAPREQWVYGRAELADGRTVDLLRGGRPLESVRPAGGFTTLPHHRWHKLFWVLPLPRVRIFAPSVASALVRNWNRRHAPADRVASLEIRFGSQPMTAAEAPVHEALVASWPDRDRSGGGNLDRLLDATSPRPEAPAPSAE